MTPDNVAIVALAIIGLLALALFPLQHRAYRLLQSRHPLAYERLGRPGWRNAQAWWSRGYWGWIRFLYGRQFAILRDPELSRIANWLIVLNTLLYLAALVIFLASSCAGLCRI